MITLLLLLQFKHFIVDFPLQTSYQYLNKGKYGHPGGVIHAGLHTLTTFCIFLGLYGNPLYLLLAILEGIIHYHIDWWKVRTSSFFNWSKKEPDGLKITSNMYFNALGFDQLLHQLTYVLLVYAVL